jgi:hypothetical protein
MLCLSIHAVSEMFRGGKVVMLSPFDRSRFMAGGATLKFAMEIDLEGKEGR